MSETEISKIEQLVNGIESEEVRTETRLRLLFDLVCKKKGSINIPELYVDPMIDFCQRKSDDLKGMYDHDNQSALLTYAARLANLAGRTEQAQQLYEGAIKLLDENEYAQAAAKVAVEAGMKTRAEELYGKICLFYEERRDFVTAARIADEAGMSKKAEGYRALQEELKKIPSYLDIK